MAKKVAIVERAFQWCGNSLKNADKSIRNSEICGRMPGVQRGSMAYQVPETLISEIVSTQVDRPDVECSIPLIAVCTGAIGPSGLEPSDSPIKALMDADLWVANPNQ